MNKKYDYLLKYISNDTYKKIKDNKSKYILDILADNYRDIDLNIKYLLKYGVSNIDKVIYERIEDIILEHNEFIKLIKEYEHSLSQEEIIRIFENV